ncbi:cell cycle RNA binding protein whi3 [Sporothrix bragantina]|uniref:Cell cycle RNA binding protein whi3 n=1 Tax=Sporothrix bragantina TaxID=671064 RepID=A0ABP0B7P3_9PEZI
MADTKDAIGASVPERLSTAFANTNQNQVQSQSSQRSVPATGAQNGIMSTFRPQPIGPPSAKPSTNPIPIAASAPSTTNGLYSAGPFSATSSVPTSSVYKVVVHPHTEKAAQLLHEAIPVAIKDVANTEIITLGASNSIPSTVLSFKSMESAFSANLALCICFSDDMQYSIELLDASGLRVTMPEITSRAPASATTSSSSLSSSRGSARMAHAFTAFDAGVSAPPVSAPPVTYYGNGAGTSGSNGMGNGISNNNMSASLGNTSNLTNSEPIGPTAAAAFRSYSVHSPIGNHLGDRARISGRDLIRDESLYEDETFGILSSAPYASSNAVSNNAMHSNAGLPRIPSYPEVTSHAQPRRATEPFAGLAGLSGLSGLSDLSEAFNGLSVSDRGLLGLVESQGAVNGAANGHTARTSRSTPSGPMPPGPMPAELSASVSGRYSSMQGHPSQYIDSQYHNGPSQYHIPRMPAVNPSDQHPPCNTLYVGNIPHQTTEDELKSLFSRQRGFKRMVYRNNKSNSNCFVEFENISFATKTLFDLYGVELLHSVRGGIRLSFSKNPLGVRSQNNPNNPANYRAPQAHQAAPGLFAPPPGLSAPPGLGNTGAVHNANGPRSQQHAAAQYLAQLPTMSSVPPPTSMPQMNPLPPMAHIPHPESSISPSREYPLANSVWPQPPVYSNLGQNGNSSNSIRVSNLPPFMMGR